MSYKLIPNPTNFIKRSQKDLQINFEKINTLVIQNHFGFQSEQFGKHASTVLTKRSADPSTAVDEIALYSKEDDAGIDRTFLREENNGSIYQLSPFLGIYSYGIIDLRIPTGIPSIIGSEGYVPMINGIQYNVKEVYRWFEEGRHEANTQKIQITFENGDVPANLYPILCPFLNANNQPKNSIRPYISEVAEKQIVITFPNPDFKITPLAARLSFILVGR